MSELDIQVTKIGNRWHARLVKGDIVLDEIPGQKNASNGMGCLAATIVAKLKKRIGEIYLQSDSERDYGQEFEYHVRYNNVQVIDVYDNESVIFDGSWNEFYNFCVEQ